MKGRLHFLPPSTLHKKYYHIHRLFYQTIEIVPIDISAIRIMQNSKNYESISQAITIFDRCISYSSFTNTHPTKGHGKLISKLIAAEISGINDGIDEYVVNTFHAFAQYKTEIMINVADVMNNLEDKHLINDILCSPEISEWPPVDTEFETRSDNKNLIQPQLIKIFPNAKVINLVMNANDKHENIYTISFDHLLTIIVGTPVEKVEVVIYWTEKDGICWLKALWNLYGQKIRELCNETGYSITYGAYDGYETLEIYKIA